MKNQTKIYISSQLFFLAIIHFSCSFSVYETLCEYEKAAISFVNCVISLWCAQGSTQNNIVCRLVFLLDVFYDQKYSEIKCVTTMTFWKPFFLEISIIFSSSLFICGKRNLNKL